MPIIAHVGIDGSAKTYGMAQDCARIAAKNKKLNNGREIWSLQPMEGARLLEHPHQILYLSNAHIFLDELQRYYPAQNAKIDEITHHIISTHRHQKNIIHWASQDWRFVHYFWRYETSHAWVYKALMRDPETGVSKIKRHRRILLEGKDLELRRRRPPIIKKEGFWITKKGISRFNSYEKVGVVINKITPEYVASIKDPRSDFVLPDDVEEPQNEEDSSNGKERELDPKKERGEGDAKLNGEDHAE